MSNTKDELETKLFLAEMEEERLQKEMTEFRKSQPDGGDSRPQWKKNEDAKEYQRLWTAIDEAQDEIENIEEALEAVA